jgi:hypothetical protein
MIEFVIWIILCFVGIVVVIVLLRGEIFRGTIKAGTYRSLAVGTCQGGTRYHSYICDTLDGKGCLDKYGNLTFDIEVKKENCIAPPPASPAPVAISRGVSGVTLRGGYDPSQIPLNSTVVWENRKITRQGYNLFSMEGKISTLQSLSRELNGEDEKTIDTKKIVRSKRSTPRKITFPERVRGASPFFFGSYTRGFLLLKTKEGWMSNVDAKISYVDNDRLHRYTSVYFCVSPISISENEMTCYLYAFGCGKRGWLDDGAIGEWKSVVTFEKKDDQVLLQGNEVFVEVLDFDHETISHDSRYRFLITRT